MEYEFIILIVAFTIIICVTFFSLYKMVTFFFLRKVIAYIMQPTSINKYHVVKKIKKRIGTEKIVYDKGIYPLDTLFSITDINNSELLFFKKGTAKPLSFFSSDKNDAKLLKSVIKTTIWGKLFGSDREIGFTTILVIICVMSLLLIFYLVYSNNQLSTQMQLLQQQLTIYYNATRINGGIIIGR